MRNFRWLMSSRFFFNFAVRMQAVIVGWRMYTLTEDPLQLGLIGLAEAVPALGIAIFAGYIVDRNKPITIYASVLWASLSSAVIVLFSQAGMLSVSGQVWSLYAASFITGFARAFSQPAMYAIVPKLRPREDWSRASAWMSSTMQTAGILGPAVGGIVFGWLGPEVASIGPVLGVVASMVSIYLINVKIDPPNIKRGTAGVREELFSGIRFVWGHPILLPALSLDMISVLFGGVTALLPIFAAEVLHIGAMGLGILRASPAIGSAAMSFALTKLDVQEKAGRWMLASVFGFGLCMLIFGLSHSFYLSLSVLILSGAFDSVSVVVRSSAVQFVSPDHMRGRISAVNSIFIGSSNELGEFESGIAAKFLGTVPAVVAGAAACLITVLWLGLSSRALRELNLNDLQAQP